MSLDPVETNPDHDAVVFENERVRVSSTPTGPATGRGRARGDCSPLARSDYRSNAVGWRAS
jgi:hypothetical protein